MIGELGTYDYILLGVIAFGLLFSLFIGINRMLRLIIGNYVLVAITLAIRNLIDIIITLLDNKGSVLIENMNENANINSLIGNTCTGANSVLSGSANVCVSQDQLHRIDSLGTFLQTSRSTIILIIYFVLIILIFAKSSIGLANIQNKVKKFFLSFVFAPLTVMSILTTLIVVFKGNEFFVSNSVMSYSQLFTNQYIKLTVSWLPLWFLLPGFLLIIFSLEFNISFPKISLKRKPKKLPEMEDFPPMEGGGH